MEPLELTGRITSASNATFLGLLGDTTVVYKPIAGERPLWDFPDGNLAGREVAAYLVSEALGWNIVPRTWLGDGPMGPGMLQLWQDEDPEQAPVDLVTSAAEGWLQVLEGTDDRDRPLVLVHENSVALRRMAVFDVIANNADRKGAHILPMTSGHRYGVDHGLTFHAEHKLRTVLWGWVDEPLTDDELAGVRTLLTARLDIDELVTAFELDALAERCERLLSDATFPAPRGQMPAFPWPLF